MGNGLCLLTGGIDRRTESVKRDFAFVRPACFCLAKEEGSCEE